MTDLTKMRTSTAFAAALFWLTSTGAALAGPVDLLPGRWAGWGHIALEGGSVERVKCIATYFSEEGGSELRHNLRCASPSYRIDARARLKLLSGRISGEWLERTYSTGGAVTGQVEDDGLQVNIVGDAFEADMKVATTRCHQSVDISPKGMGVTRIAVELAKC